MEYRIELTPQKILKKKFTKDVKGYQSGEVDAFLDLIMKDYEVFLAYQKAMSSHIEEMSAKLENAEKKANEASEKEDSLRESLRKLELDNASLREKLRNIKPSDSPTAENLQYIQRINALENYLYSIGIDPNKAIKGR